MRRGRVLRGNVPAAAFRFLGGRSRNGVRPRPVRPGGEPESIAESESFEEESRSVDSDTRRDGWVDGQKCQQES